MEKRYKKRKADPMSAKESFKVILFHIIFALIVFGGFSLYQYYFPKTKEEIAREKDPNRKIYFEKFIASEYHPELKEKISRLDSISRNLNEILYFVDYQKNNLELQSKNL